MRTRMFLESSYIIFRRNRYKDVLKDRSGFINSTTSCATSWGFCFHFCGSSVCYTPALQEEERSDSDMLSVVVKNLFSSWPKLVPQANCLYEALTVGIELISERSCLVALSEDIKGGGKERGESGITGDGARERGEGTQCTPAPR